MRRLLAGLSIAWLAGCDTGGSSPTAAGSGSGSAAGSASGAASGFSADLARELAAANGSGSAAVADAARPSAGSAAAGSGSAAVADAAKPGAGSAAAGSGSAAVADAAKPGAGSAAADAAKPGAGSAKPGAGSAAVADAAKPGAGSAAVADAAKPTEPSRPVPFGAGPIIQPAGAVPRKVSVPAELAAIRLSLLPNWDRDIHDAGTISLAVKIPGRADSAVFVFRYGYEDGAAPADRDAYKKWLGDKRLLVVRQDRQAGAAWYLEGVDAAGNPAFRVVVTWGNRKLVCYGSLYRDAESSRLGDLRDQTIIQAKQICETVAL